MCGICGVLTFNRSPVQKKTICEMTQILSHRGPDDKGVYTDRNFGAGHRRLSIIDLSKKGKQPLAYRDYVITYNGEIYNFQEIREELG